MPRVAEQVLPRYVPIGTNAINDEPVDIEVVVGVDGTVIQTRLARSAPDQVEFPKLAVIATSQWRFDPAFREGRPVPVLVILRFTAEPADPPSDVARVRATMESLPAEPLPQQESAAPPTTSASDTDPPAGLQPPGLLRVVEPRYTLNAMRTLIQGIRPWTWLSTSMAG